MSGTEGDASSQALAVHRTVVGVLGLYASDAARAELLWVDAAGMWFTEVTPRRQGAAQLSVAVDDTGQDLTITVGGTTFEAWGGGSDLRYVTELAEAVFAGRVEEAGWRTDAFARIHTRSGVLRMGAAHLPLPWRWRRSRRYLPYD